MRSISWQTLRSTFFFSLPFAGKTNDRTASSVRIVNLRLIRPIVTSKRFCLQLQTSISNECAASIDIQKRTYSNRSNMFPSFKRQSISNPPIKRRPNSNSIRFEFFKLPLRTLDRNTSIVTHTHTHVFRPIWCWHVDCTLHLTNRSAILLIIHFYSHDLIWI